MLLEHGGETLALKAMEMVDVTADPPQERAVDLVGLVGGAEVHDEFVLELKGAQLQQRLLLSARGRTS